MPPGARAFGRHDPRQARARLLLAVATGLAVGAVIPARFGVALRAVAGWNASALAMTALSWVIIMRDGAAQTRRRAAADDPGRSTVWGLVLAASAFSVLATTVVLRQARALAPDARDVFIVLCLTAVASAWLLTHTAYTLRYAHLYYRDDDEGEGGLTFPGNAHPAYVDFAYFAFTIGMCFQVSDVCITSPTIRRAVLAHAMLSFLYNTAILAVAINLVIGIVG